MSATCAACMQPIARRNQVVIAGTEVFHRGCASNIENSRYHRLAKRINELERELEGARRSETRATHESIINQERLGMSEVKLEQAIRSNTRLQRDNGSLSSELLQARRERDAARSEAALHQTLGPIRPQEPPTATTPDSNPDGKDDTEMRFAMLELD